MRIGRPKKVSHAPTLSELGITRDQSSQWQKLAAIPEAEFEEMLSRPGLKHTTEGLIRRCHGRVAEVLSAGQLDNESQLRELVVLLRKLGPKAVREVWLAVKKIADAGGLQ